MTELRPAPPTFLLARRILVWMWGPRWWLAWGGICALGVFAVAAHPRHWYPAIPFPELVMSKPISGIWLLRLTLINLASPLVVGWLSIGFRIRWMLARSEFWRDVATLPLSRIHTLHSLLLATCMMAASFGVWLKVAAFARVVAEGWITNDWDQLGHFLYNYNRWFEFLGNSPAGGAYWYLVTQSLLIDLVGYIAGVVLPAWVVVSARSATLGVLGAFVTCLGMTAYSVFLSSMAARFLRPFLAPLTSGGVLIDVFALSGLATSIALFALAYYVLRAQFTRGPLPSEGAP